jgi:hypothetical protein
MIIRRATKVVAGTTMPRSATPSLPRAWPEGPREAGIGQWRGCQAAPKYTWGANSPLRGRIFLRKTLLSPPRSRPIFTAILMGRGFAGGLPCQASSEGDQPFPSSPFAHSIPQSHRRASGDLFRASLRERKRKTEFGEQTVQMSYWRKPVSTDVQSTTLLAWAGFRIKPGMTSSGSGPE